MGLFTERYEPSFEEEDRLRRENRELRESLDRVKLALEHNEAIRQEEKKRAEGVKRENEELRKALEEISNLISKYKPNDALKIDYKCSRCGAKLCKLWMQNIPYFFPDTLMCVDCAELDQRWPYDEANSDMIGHLVPAIPNDEGTLFWLHSRAPEHQIRWWRGLPLRDPGKVRT